MTGGELTLLLTAAGAGPPGLWFLVREFRKTRSADDALDQGLRIKDDSIATLRADLAEARKIAEAARLDQRLFVQQRRDEMAAAEEEMTKWRSRVRGIERDRDVLRKIVKDLVADIRLVKREEMPVAALNTGLVEDIDFFPGP